MASTVFISPHRSKSNRLGDWHHQPHSASMESNKQFGRSFPQHWYLDFLQRNDYCRNWKPRFTLNSQFQGESDWAFSAISLARFWHGLPLIVDLINFWTLTKVRPFGSSEMSLGVKHGTKCWWSVSHILVLKIVAGQFMTSRVAFRLCVANHKYPPFNYELDNYSMQSWMVRLKLLLGMSHLFSLVRSGCDGTRTFQEVELFIEPCRSTS